MALFAEIPGFGAWSERAEKAMRAPVGAVSPLWMAFGAVASAGVAYWLFTQWTQAVNFEALAGAKPATKPVKIEVEAPPAVVAAPEPAPAPVEAAPVEISPVEPAAIEAATVEAAPAEPPPAETAPAVAPPSPDDLTRMSGIGPKLSEALAARGVTRFAQIAAWTHEDLEAVDKALSLKGRAVREAWVAQARRLAGVQ